MVKDLSKKKEELVESAVSKNESKDIKKVSGLFSKLKSLVLIKKVQKEQQEENEKDICLKNRERYLRDSQQTTFVGIPEFDLIVNNMKEYSKGDVYSKPSYDDDSKFFGINGNAKLTNGIKVRIASAFSSEISKGSNYNSGFISPDAEFRYVTFDYGLPEIANTQDIGLYDYNAHMNILQKYDDNLFESYQHKLVDVNSVPKRTVWANGCSIGFYGMPWLVNPNKIITGDEVDKRIDFSQISKEDLIKLYENLNHDELKKVLRTDVVLREEKGCIDIDLHQNKFLSSFVTFAKYPRYSNNTKCNWYVNGKWMGVTFEDFLPSPSCHYRFQRYSIFSMLPMLFEYQSDQKNKYVDNEKDVYQVLQETGKIYLVKHNMKLCYSNPTNELFLMRNALFDEGVIYDREDGRNLEVYTLDKEDMKVYISDKEDMKKLNHLLTKENVMDLFEYAKLCYQKKIKNLQGANENLLSRDDENLLEQ